MYTTTSEVSNLTGYEVDGAHVQMAQAIVELYTGRGEARVEDPDDMYILKLATAYQAAYIQENHQTVFKQVGIESMGQDSFSIKLANEDSPFIAPLTRMACQRLSWFRSRSVTTQPAGRVPFKIAWRYD